MTKNITLAVDETVLAEARRYAAEHGTTVNGLVREHLQQIARSRSRAKQIVAELRALSEKSTARLGPGYRFSREETYDR